MTDPIKKEFTMETCFSIPELKGADTTRSARDYAKIVCGANDVTSFEVTSKYTYMDKTGEIYSFCERINATFFCSEPSTRPVTGSIPSWERGSKGSKTPHPVKKKDYL